jgi:hypothetical protein
MRLPWRRLFVDQSPARFEYHLMRPKNLFPENVLKRSVQSKNEY